MGSKADRYFTIRRYVEAFNWYEEMYKTYNPNISYVSIQFNYDKLKEYTIYVTRVKKMNLPAY